ncbi:MAG: hypothetical protein KIT08_05850 [Anaerolineales bacterium]|nr:MAG: hypothetical protein KIT08_05850 [Anaerolineales bacterium]
MKKLALIFAATALFLVVTPARAQETGLILSMSRDFGYAGFGSDIEGLFSLRASGPSDLQRVDFYIEDELIGSVAEEPYRVQFTTKDYEPGERTMYALGYLSDGSQLRSNEFTRIFLSAEQARGKMLELVFPILGIVLVVTLVTTVVPALFGRGKPVRGKYGMSGGAVCPKCDLPFPLRFFSFNMGARKFERCPHCGKWSMVRRASKEDLAAAEARWAALDAPGQPAPRDSRQDEQIDNSRYEN